MYKKLFTFVVFVTTILSVQAESLTIADVVLPQNGTAYIDIELNNPSSVYNAFTFAVQLPDGLSPVMDGEGNPLFTKGERMGSKTPQSGYITESKQIRLGLITDGTAISGTSGVLLSPAIQLTESVPVGTKFTVRLVDAIFTTTSLIKESLSDVEFNVTVGEPVDPRIILDETSTTAPEASGEPVDVRVRRTIKANEWSTICLPFAMTEAQTKAAFGDDVQLAMFSDWSSEEDEDDDEIIVGIEISFSSVDVADGIEANTPLLIKVTNKVDEFTVDGVTIDPEEEPSVMIKHGTKKRDPESYMIGTYQAETVLDNLTLFLNGNKFWYSTGKTKMKAYRAYFNIYDILTEVEDAYAAVKMAIDVDGTTTHVEGINMNDGEGAVYDMSGRRVSKPSQRGIYIVNGQKVLVK